MSTIKDKLSFTYNDKSSKDFGVTQVSLDNGMFEESLVASRSIREEKLVNSKRSLYSGLEKENLSFPLTLAFDKGFNEKKTQDVTDWLFGKEYYSKMMFENDEKNNVYVSGWATPIIDNAQTKTLFKPSTTYKVTYKFRLDSLAEGTTAFNQNAHGTLALHSGKDALLYPTIKLVDSEAENVQDANTWRVGTIRERSVVFTTPDNLNDVNAGYKLIAYTRRSMKGDTLVGYENGIFYDIKVELVQEDRNLLINSSVPVTSQSYMAKGYTMTDKMVEGADYFFRAKMTLGTGKTWVRIFFNDGYNMLAPLQKDTDGTYYSNFKGKSRMITDPDTIQVYIGSVTVTGVNSTIEWAKLVKSPKPFTKFTKCPRDLAIQQFDVVGNNYFLTDYINSSATIVKPKMVYCMPNGDASIVHTGTGQGYITLNMQTNSPYFYGEMEVAYAMMFDTTTQTVDVINRGKPNPEAILEIRPTKDGSATVRMNGVAVQVNNLKAGEVVGIYVDDEDITSNLPNVYHYNDFIGDLSALSLKAGLNTMQVSGTAQPTVYYIFQPYYNK